MLAVVSLSGQNDPFLENRMVILVLASSPGEENSWVHSTCTCAALQVPSPEEK